MDKASRLLNYVGKFLLYALMTPIYWISRLIPKNNNIWIFGAWFGEQYNDNSKYLFEYVNQYHPQIKAIWLSKNKIIIDQIRTKGYNAYHAYSIKGFIYSAKAKVGIVNMGIIDLNKFIPPDTIINLWHGIPLKKIMYDDEINKSLTNNRIKKLKKLVFPFTRYPENSEMMIACAPEDQKNIASAFKLPVEKVKITGYPRNDALFVPKIDELSNSHKVLYTPTHRRAGKINIGKLLVNGIFEIDNELNKLNTTLYIKLHFYHQNEIDQLENTINIHNLSNIKIVKDKDIEGDIYTYLSKFDTLITDYSSIYFDYLLTNKPIIFAPFDLDDYLKNDREQYYNYNDVTPGPKCANWPEICKWIALFKANPSLYSNERESIKNKFHQFQNSNSSKRVCEEILKLISL
jgi:CDP-glycerol glycerophosphotransferase (TagB/SpsB family)